MPWVSSTLSASVLARRAAGIPCVWPYNEARKASVSWIDGTLAYDTDAAFPPSRVIDGFAHAGRHSRPATSSTQRALLFNSITTSAMIFDSIAIWGSNLDTCTSILVHVVDGITPTQIASLSAPSYGDGRIFSMDLYHTGSTPRLYTADLVAVEFNLAPAGFPDVREVWLGQRAQLAAWPRTGLQDQSGDSTAGTLESLSGARTRSGYAQGRAVRSLRLDLTGADLAVGQRISDESRGLRDPLVWVEGSRAYLMRAQSPAYNPTNQGAGLHRELELELVEQPPFLAWESLP